MKFNQLIVTCALASAASLSQAAPIWQDFSVTALYGSNYELGSEDRTTATVEYAAKFKYADFFFFNDHQWEEGNVQTNYFEFSPRFSLGEISGTKLEFGPIKDVLVATTWESNNSAVNFDNFLYGVGFDLAIPKFQYAQLNFYKASNELGKDDYQMSFVYGIPFKIGSEEFLADAFLDWSTGEGPDHASELNWTSQYKWNVGKHISPKTKLYVGVEHSVWNNKFGVKGVNQNDVSALVKYHF